MDCLKILVLNVLFFAVANARLLGVCYDEHKCAQCAGYTWCEELQECLRFWESPCEIKNE
jgi:hypothetical protein